MPRLAVYLAPFSEYQSNIATRNFAQALACLPERKWTQTSKRRWMCARLGLLSPLINVGWRGANVRSGVVYVEALAAYGRLEECQQALNRLTVLPGIARYHEELIREFSKYNLPLSIELIDALPNSKKTVYHQALKLSFLHTQLNLNQSCLDNKRNNNSAEELKHYQEQLSLLNTPSNRQKHPDLLLLFSNWNARSLEAKLRQFNLYQTYFSLPLLTVESRHTTFNSLNIKLKSPIRSHPLSYLPSTATTQHDKLKVSVIVTMYNSSSYLESTLRSLLKQSWLNLEIIVVDDASTDQSLLIAQKLARIDSRLIIFSQASNKGTYLAKNLALSKITGNFIICHDSDDWAHPLKIEEQLLPLLLNKDLMASTSSWVKIDSHGNFIARTAYPFKHKNPSSLLFRKQAIASLKQTTNTSTVWQTVRTGADSELYERFKIIFGRESIKHIDKPLTIGAHRSDSLMNAEDTGTIDITARIERLKYWEQWRREHIYLLKKIR